MHELLDEESLEIEESEKDYSHHYESDCGVVARYEYQFHTVRYLTHKKTDRSPATSKVLISRFFRTNFFRTEQKFILPSIVLNGTTIKKAGLLLLENQAILKILYGFLILRTPLIRSKAYLSNNAIVKD